MKVLHPAGSVRLVTNDACTARLWLTSAATSCANVTMFILVHLVIKFALARMQAVPVLVMAYAKPAASVSVTLRGLELPIALSALRAGLVLTVQLPGLRCQALLTLAYVSAGVIHTLLHLLVPITLSMLLAFTPSCALNRRTFRRCMRLALHSNVVSETLTFPLYTMKKSLLLH
jgi:hypothetical protein